MFYKNPTKDIFYFGTSLRVTLGLLLYICNFEAMTIEALSTSGGVSGDTIHACQHL